MFRVGGKKLALIEQERRVLIEDMVVKSIGEFCTISSVRSLDEDERNSTFVIFWQWLIFSDSRFGYFGKLRLVLI